MVFVETLKHFFQKCINCSVVHLVLHLHVYTNSNQQGVLLCILHPFNSTL